MADRADQTGRCADLLRDDRRALGDVGLAQVAVGHVTATRVEHPRDHLDDRLVAHEPHVHDLGDRLACDIVLGRAEAAAHDDGVTARQRGANGEHDALVVVADLGLEERVDARQRETLADPRRVGVDDLAEEQLGADGDDLTSHGRHASRRAGTARR